ncbi:hypothetical protein HDU77_000872 [Chytriomyces hyalinus]|nr:hypothetical protein HDU77_000872 [Chytriomyces hyalinus]
MSVTYDPSSHVSSSEFTLESSSGLSENLQEFLSTGLSGLSESPTPYLSGDEIHTHFPLTTSDSMLQVLANSIIPLPEPHTSTAISIQAANTIDDEDIKAFLRWNSESDIEPTTVNSSSAARPAVTTENESSPTSLNPTNASDFSSSLNLLPSPPTTSYTSESVFNQSPHFASASFQAVYSPQTLSSLPHCHPIMPPYISYDDPRYTQNRMHGFELMTEGDQAYYGYGPAAPNFTAAETEAAYNYYDAVAASMMSVYEQHHPIQDHSHAFRWAATANAAVPLSHVSMSMIVPEDQQNPQCISTQSWPMEPVTQSVAQPQEQKLTKSGAAPSSGASSGKKACGPKSLQASGQSYSPYKRASVNPPAKSTPQMGRQSKRTPSVLMNQPSKFVGVQQLESQQLWFKTQLAEQEEIKRKVQAEREGMVAVLRQLVLKRGSVAAAAGKSECR